MLAIEFRGAIPAVRAALTLSASELEALVRSARSRHESIELVLVSDRSRLEIYSTEASYEAAFRIVLRELLARAGEREHLRDVASIEASGVAAARHLLRHAAGICGNTGLGILAELNLAVTRSRAAHTLGAELSSLFASAVEAGWRAFCETSVGDATKSQAEREIAVLEAERIVEERLVAWKAERLTTTQSEPPQRARGRGYFAALQSA